MPTYSVQKVPAWRFSCRKWMDAFRSWMDVCHSHLECRPFVSVYLQLWVALWCCECVKRGGCVSTRHTGLCDPCRPLTMSKAFSPHVFSLIRMHGAWWDLHRYLDPFAVRERVQWGARTIYVARNCWFGKLQLHCLDKHTHSIHIHVLMCTYVYLQSMHTCMQEGVHQCQTLLMK